MDISGIIRAKKCAVIAIVTISVSGKGRLYPAYSLSGSEGEDNTSSLRSRVVYPQNNHQTNQSHHNHYNSGQHKQRAYQQQQQQQHPLYHMPGSGAGLSDTPTSGNASDETLTDSDLITVARDSALLVHNGEYIGSFDDLIRIPNLIGIYAVYEKVQENINTGITVDNNKTQEFPSSENSQSNYCKLSASSGNLAQPFYGFLESDSIALDGPDSQLKSTQLEHEVNF
ncbi:PREDICTED: uncharacterized protein LOC106750589 [Dinoponera quadriceps]|uniref:Uncharacterized protein LOC106750589 n=1 Tax=Dinoponera quadriceps TaxID=609295 RepID=A0A6P3Y6K9_DINQU|nr:PREDICTED: uncharacterized protein LOC106750589 [Dinoponera quadriceps]